MRVARQIAEREGWPSVTIRRLADEIAYSQPVLYSHFESREAILAAAAVEGFGELGAVMKSAVQEGRHASALEALAASYLDFAEAFPALYEVMFSLRVHVAFGEAATPAELRYAFSQFLDLFPATPSEAQDPGEVFPERSRQAEVWAELLWANLHGIADLTRTKRFPRVHQKTRLQELVRLFQPLCDSHRVDVLPLP